MIEIKELSHTYVSKKGESVRALKDVTYTFADLGMYFVVGKSGSGKSTLLNLLGGLDKIVEGNIVVDGESLSGQTKAGFDSYRNTHIGLIFQEFNLIDGFTVFDNLDLPLKLQGKNSNDEQIAECLVRVGLEGYEKRYPAELSGGEKQRIAIARQLAKESKVILADEPTGNLDEGNSKIIFDILKKLSKEFLVIVVSHDTEAAAQYADEIVTLVDGKIKDANQLAKKSNKSNSSGIAKVKSNFPLKYASKIAINGVSRRKIRFSVTIILAVLALSLASVFNNLTIYSSEKALAHTLINNNVNFTNLIYDNYYDERGGGVSFAGHSFDSEYVNFLDTVYSHLNKIKVIELSSRFQIESTKVNPRLVYESDYIGVVHKANQITEVYGYELSVNHLPLSKDSVFITDYYAQGIINSEYYYEDGVDLVAIPGDWEVVELVGKTIVKGESASDKKIKVAGIIITESAGYMSKLESYDNADPEFKTFNYLVKEVYNTLFVSDEYMSDLAAAATYQSVDQDFFNIVVSDNQVFTSLVREFSSSAWYRRDVLTGDSLVDVNLFSFSGKSAVVALGLYNEIFNDNRTQEYYIRYNYTGNDYEAEVLRYPQHVGEKVNIKLLSANGGVLLDLGEITIAGIFFEASPTIFGGPDPRLFLHSDDFGSLAQKMYLYKKIVLSAQVSKEELTNVLQECRERNIFTRDEYSERIYNFEETLSIMSDVFMVSALVLLVVSVLMFANWTGSNIIDRRKDIGVIRAMGGTRINVFKIFFIEGLIFVAIASLMAMGLSSIATIILNTTIARQVAVGASLIFVNLSSLLLIPLIGFVSMLVASFFPLRKLNQLSPIEIIRAK